MNKKNKHLGKHGKISKAYSQKEIKGKLHKQKKVLQKLKKDIEFLKEMAKRRFIIKTITGERYIAKIKEEAIPHLLGTSSNGSLEKSVFDRVHDNFDSKIMDDYFMDDNIKRRLSVKAKALKELKEIIVEENNEGVLHLVDFEIIKNHIAEGDRKNLVAVKCTHIFETSKHAYCFRIDDDGVFFLISMIRWSANNKDKYVGSKTGKSAQLIMVRN